MNSTEIRRTAATLATATAAVLALATVSASPADAERPRPGRRLYDHRGIQRPVRGHRRGRRHAEGAAGAVPARPPAPPALSGPNNARGVAPWRHPSGTSRNGSNTKWPLI